MDITHQTSLASSKSSPPESTPPPTEPIPPQSTAFKSTRLTITAEDVINSIEYLQAFVKKAQRSIKPLGPLPQNSSPAQTNAKTDQQTSIGSGDSSRRWCLNMGGSGASKSRSVLGNSAGDDEAERKKKAEEEKEEEEKKRQLRVKAEHLERELNYLYQATRLKCERKTEVKFDFKDPELQLKFMDLAPNIVSNANGSVNANDTGNVNNVNATASGDVENLSLKEIEEGFDVISKTSFHLKELMRIILKTDGNGENEDESVPGSRFEATYIVSGKPKTFFKEGVSKGSAFSEIMTDFQGAFKELDEEAKLCLLYLSVFPANAIITKKVLFYWWMGERILQPFDGEGEVNRILKKLVEMEFIEPIIKKRRLIGFMMDPLVRLVVVNLAEAAGFSEFDEMAVPTENMSLSYKTFLVKTEKRYSRSKLQNDDNYKDSDLENIRTLFNVNDPYPDFKQLKFSKMTKVNVLYLGRWQEAATYSGCTHHIEVDKIEFLKGLKNMKHLIFVSFRGISRISNLPGDDALSNLNDLRVLDFSACYGLETLPDLSFLKKLTYLDLSDCYLLDHIPKGIASLLELRVLKGFLIGESADNSHSSTLEDLVRMKKLRKLSIKSSRDDFPTIKELNCLKGLVALVKLTIIWGGKTSKEKQKQNTDESSEKSGQGVANIAAEKEKRKNQIMRGLESLNPWTGKTKKSHAKKSAPMLGVKGRDKKKGKAVTENLSEEQQKKAVVRERWKRAFRLVKAILAVESTIHLKNLQKLELQCFPGTAAPPWLTSIAVRRLKKLYISGGNLRDLGMTDGEPLRWTVKILRLKFLDELRMDWRELQYRFPHLVYLEKVRCPNLTFFPCDKSGAWLKQDTDLKQLQEMDLGLSWSFLARKSFETLGEHKRDPDKVNPSQHKGNLNEENSSRYSKDSGNDDAS